VSAISDHDLPGLTALVRSRLPSCSSAVLVGSAVINRGGCVGDIDITGLDHSVAIGEDRSDASVYGELPLHIVVYNPLHFLIIRSHADLVFLFLREIRKLLEGIVLFDDDGTLKQTLDSFRTVRIPYDRLQPLVNAVSVYRPDGDAIPQNRLAFYHAVENLSFAWMHFDMKYRYTKPKWLIDDAKLVSSTNLLELLRTISSELTAQSDVSVCVRELRLRAPSSTETRASRLCVNNLDDAESLIRKGRVIEAVWPLRMSCYLLAEFWAECRELPYQDLRSIESLFKEMISADHSLAILLEELLLLDKPLNAHMLSLWQSTQTEFLDSWNRIEKTV
jgi:hypothetical protein